MSDSAADPNRIHKNSFHWRNNSGELDVFEAARYFSTAVDQALPAYINGREDRHYAALPVRRSLDVPIMIRSKPIPPEYNHHHYNLDPKQLIKDHNNKKFKQPSSPGGRLASFLNSLFNQASLKKKKTSKSGRDFEEENPNAERKRRSSISNFRITVTSKTAAAAADKGSGFRNPPTKSYKGGDHDAAEKKGVDFEKTVGRVRSWERRGLREWSEEDDGGESDSSSDLFDLPNSCGFPLHETTHIQSISIATPIFTVT